MSNISSINPPATLTVLECPEGRLLTKRFDAAGTKHDFQAGGIFKIHELRASTWPELLEALSCLVEIPTMCVVRGAPVDDCPRADSADVDPWVYRRLHDRPDEPANFVSVARPWVVYDFDETSAPFDLGDPEGSVRAWHATLQPELRDAQSAFFLSSSAHRSPCVRGKLVVWYRRAISEAAARAYAIHYRADSSVAGAVQPNFFAAPVFEGCADPLAEHRAPIVFKGEPAAPPAGVTLKSLRARTAPASVCLETLPRGDAGIVAALGPWEAFVGMRIQICGLLGGLMRKLDFSGDECAAVLREWLKYDPACDVERGVRYALLAWGKTALEVTGRGRLADQLGDKHAHIIETACVRARVGRTRPIVPYVRSAK